MELTGLEGLLPPRQHAQGQRSGGRQAFQRQHVLAFLPVGQKQSQVIGASGLGTCVRRSPSATVELSLSLNGPEWGCEGLPPEHGEDAGHLPHRTDLIPDDFLPDGAGSA